MRTYLIGKLCVMSTVPSKIFGYTSYTKFFPNRSSVEQYSKINCTFLTVIALGQ